MRVFLVLCSVLLFGTLCLAQQRKSLEGTMSDRPLVHDPSIVPCGDTTYVFGTGHGVSQLFTTDMHTWHYGRQCLDTLPRWVYERLPRASMHVWAPDVIYYGGQWHMFYCCSAFGKNTSVIGHAVSPTLNQQSSAYGWKDRGMIVQSVPGRDYWNAIDPNIVVDYDGMPWMTFGSFWGGIKLVRLNYNLDGIAYPEEWYDLAVRHPKAKRMLENAIEAPYIFKHDGYYYLFVSIDYCCRGKESTYRVVVGRSQKVSGPYVDHNNVPMTEGGGLLVAEGDKKEWSAMGHCSVATVGGRDILALHAYDMQTGHSYLLTPQIEWDKDGWPKVVMSSK